MFNNDQNTCIFLNVCFVKIAIPCFCMPSHIIMLEHRSSPIPHLWLTEFIFGGHYNVRPASVVIGQGSYVYGCTKLTLG